jgi:putative ABC transport system ATP-binding protein
MDISNVFTPNKVTQSQPASIRVEEVVKVYQGQAGSLQALKGINLEINDGDFVTITGRSGSGKTTLVNMLTGLDRLTSGKIWVGDTAIHSLNE